MKLSILLSLLLVTLLPQSRPTQPADYVVLNGDYEVKAQGYNIYPIQVPPGKVGVLRGRLSVYGSVSQDLEVCVFDQENLEKFVNRHPALSVSCTGRVKLKTIDVTVPAGNHHILLNNSYSLLTAKVVNIFVGISFIPQPKPSSAPLADSSDAPLWAEAEYNNKNKLIALKALHLTDASCGDKLNEAVTITDVHYDEEEIQYFTVKRPSGQRKNVYIVWDRIAKPDKGHAHTLIRENNKVRVKGFLCGNGGYWYADDIILENTP